MANFHSDEWIMARLAEHNEEVEKLLKEVQYDIMKFAVAMELAEEEYYD